jgi:site-specific DNA recombinase
MTNREPKRTPRIHLVESLDEVPEPVTALYVRVTAEESFTTDLSIPNQKRRALEVCGERGWPTAKLYAEPKHVGGDAGPEQRPALAALVADIERGRVRRILVRHTDRLWRSTSLQDQLLRVFSRNAVELWDFSHQHDYRSAHGKFSTIVLGAAAQLEKDLTSERIVEMKRGKAHAGRSGGGPPPYGYTSQARIRHELIAAGMTPEAAAEEACRRLPAPKRLYVDEKEAAVVRKVFDLYTKEHHGCRRITEALNAAGDRRRSGRLWVTQKVDKILTDPTVAGFVTYDEAAYQARQRKKAPKVRQQYFPGEHEPVISQAQWEEALALRVQNAKLLRTKSRRADKPFGLTGILRCGLCGAPMVGKSSGVKLDQFKYYQCTARKYRGKRFGCTAPFIPAGVAESVVLSDVEQLLSSPAFVHEFMVKANERLREHRPEAVRAVTELEGQLRAVERAVGKFSERYESAADAETEELAWTKLKEAMVRKKAIESKLTEARKVAGSAATPTVSLAQTEEYLGELRSHLSRQPDKLRHLLSLLRVRHDLRVRAYDGKRLVLSIRLDDAAVGAHEDGVRNRLVVVTGGADAEQSVSHVLSRELALPDRDTSERWAERENASGTHRCQCGCGKLIHVIPVHRTKGIPKFLPAHHRMFMTGFVADLNANGLLTIAQAAKRLGMGETTLRRKAPELGLSEERVPWGRRFPMRLYRASEIDALDQSRSEDARQL